VGSAVERAGTQFTCFTSTKVQILNRDRVGRCWLWAGTQFACFTGTKVQILTQLELYGGQTALVLLLQKYLLYWCKSRHLLYWYKSANTDAGRAE
jgi:aminopeptidase C